MSVSAPTVDWVRGRECGADDMALCRTRPRSANCSERQKQKKWKNRNTCPSTPRLTYTYAQNFSCPFLCNALLLLILD